MSLQHVTVELREADTAAEVDFWALLGSSASSRRRR